GKTPSTNNESYYNSNDYMFVTPDDLTGSTYLLDSSKRHISNDGFLSIKTNTIPSDSVMVTCIGNIGNCGISTKPCATNQQINSITDINQNLANPMALYYFLKICGNQLEKMASTTVMPILSKGKFENIDISLPDIHTQAKIAQIGSSLDDKIALNNKINSQLEEIIDLIYNYWFVQFDFPDENGRPYKSSGGKMVYNPELDCDIPEGWKALALKDKLEFKRGTEVGGKAYSNTRESDNYIKFYRVRDMDSDSLTWVDGSNNKVRILKPGDVAVSFDGTAGKIGVNINGAISSGIRHIFDKTGDMPDSVIWSIFRSNSIQEILRQYVASRGSILAHAGGAIDDMQIPYDAEIYREYAKIADPIYKLIVNNLQENQQLASLRDWLLPMLMNGQVVIK
ncbi:MAG: restriction endonuclease subunit S, partial [Candidatus Saccharibacteria bacterium]|nr:restriction endonuclease subunit S [Candidatus Saccharibacteria bacterium]